MQKKKRFLKETKRELADGLQNMFRGNGEIHHLNATSHPFTAMRRGGSGAKPWHIALLTGLCWLLFVPNAQARMPLPIPIGLEFVVLVIAAFLLPIITFVTSLIQRRYPSNKLKIWNIFGTLAGLAGLVFTRVWGQWAFVPVGFLIATIVVLTSNKNQGSSKKTEITTET